MLLIDQPPQIIEEITPALSKEIGCASLWINFRQGLMSETIDKHIEYYRSYMTKCINGESVPIHMGAKNEH